MACGVPLTPEQRATILRVWTETTNASEAARQAGCSTRSALRTLRMERAPNAATLYAQALDGEMQAHLATVRKARGRLHRALDVADDAAVPDLARAANDSLRAVSAVQVAHAKLTGSMVEKHDVTSGGAPLASVVLMPSLDDELPGTTDPLAAEPGASD